MKIIKNENFNKIGGGWSPTKQEGRYWLNQDEVKRLNELGYFVSTLSSGKNFFKAPREGEHRYYVHDRENQLVDSQNVKRALTPVGSSKLRQVEYYD